MIRMKGYKEETAGFMTTGQKVIRIVGAPIIGWLIDRYGHRFHLVALAPLVYILANSLIGFTNAHPLVALVFQSIAGLINGMPLNVSIPLLVADQDKLGTAFGVWRAFNNSGATIVSTHSLVASPSLTFSRWKLFTVSCKTALKRWATAAC